MGWWSRRFWKLQDQDDESYIDIYILFNLTLALCLSLLLMMTDDYITPTGITVKNVNNFVKYTFITQCKIHSCSSSSSTPSIRFSMCGYQLGHSTPTVYAHSCIAQTDVVRPTWSLMYFSSPFLVIAPSWKLPSTISPSLNTIKHGKPYTLYFSMSCLFPSVQSTFTTFNFPLNS